MRRHHLTPRADWRERARALGFAFAEIAGEPYWDETACWEFTAAEVDTLEAATAELERLARAAADHAVRADRHALLGIPDAAWPLVVQSWERQEPSLYGRMDLRWDGTGQPRLLEYNADTPTSLYESAVVQWEWLTCAFPDADQFNSIHEALIAAWPTLHLPRGCTSPAGAIRTRTAAPSITCAIPPSRPASTRRSCSSRRSAGMAGASSISTAGGSRPASSSILGSSCCATRSATTSPGRRRAGSSRRWRLLLSGKGILALLWELFPGHPNLLPAFREPGRTGGDEIAKPLFGREGANITAPGLQTDGLYGSEGYVYQQWAELPHVDGRYAVIGSWVIAGEPHGIGIREDATPITRDTSRFVPHFFRGTA